MVFSLYSCCSGNLELVNKVARVEEKYKCPAGYMVWISYFNNPTIRKRISVGKYTFEHINPGDTLTFQVWEKKIDSYIHEYKN